MNKPFKTIEVGNIVSLIDSSLKIYDGLNPGTYYLRFDKNRGNFLEKTDSIKVNEKVYGTQRRKAEKVLKTFSAFEKNLGVLMSGDKGIGKSLFTKILMEDASREYPVIIIEGAVPGLVQFINSVKQECLIIFDEFDKMFTKSNENELGQQDLLLSLFDGLSQGKKMFVITCNNIHKISEFLVNRPGRFHYHFRFDYPTTEETREYLQDKLQAEYCDKIEDVISFSKKVKLNYDCLRSIVFELNQGYTFKEAIDDLNIMRMENEPYRIEVTLENGMVFKSRSSQYLNLFDKELLNDVYMVGKIDKRSVFLNVEFKIPGIKLIEEDDMHIELTDEAMVSYVDDSYDDEEFNKEVVKLRCMKIKSLVITKARKNDSYGYSQFL